MRAAYARRYMDTHSHTANELSDTNTHKRNRLASTSLHAILSNLTHTRSGWTVLSLSALA